MSLACTARSSDNAASSAVAVALQAWGAQPAALVQLLREVQARLGWLPPGAVAALAQALGLTTAQVQGVASFYRFFHLAPVGRYRLLLADHISDRMAGNQALLTELCRRLRVAPGQVRDDGLVSVALASCTGLCDQGPALLVNHHQVVTRLDSARVAEVVRLVEARVPAQDWPADWQQVSAPVHRADVLLGSALQPGQALAAAWARGPQAPQALIDEVMASRLRGRGGAGFGTGDKWAGCAASPVTAPGQTRHVVCNADEGEPGTFKDRVLLSDHADTVFEGMTLAALAVGARQGWVYLRGEYRFLLEHLQAVLARRRAAGLLGAGIAGRAGFDFDIQIHLGAGAYVCGEETSLLESLEGRRGTPRVRPPFPSQHGLFGQPTVVNNVETFCAAAHIALHGGAWWAAIGTPRSSGTKIHSVAGDCARPGLYEYPLGTPVAQLLADCGATDTQAVQVGGPSGTCISAAEFGRRIAFEDLPSAGAFTVFDQRRDMLGVARHFAHFFAHESCGFCTPCRVGTTLVAQRLDRIASGHAGAADIALIERVLPWLDKASHCGLGGTAANPVRDTLRRFAPAYQVRLQAQSHPPAFDLDAELSSARRATGRDDAGAHLHAGEHAVTHDRGPPP